MPLPFRVSDLCSTVPSATSSICDRINKVFLHLPHLLCQAFQWMFNDDGSLSTNFINEAGSIPVGCCLFRCGLTVPAGWLEANGQEVSRADFPALFSVLGTLWGVGNGTTTFKVPDLRDRFPLGASPTKPVGTLGGSFSHVQTVAELAAHTHTYRKVLDPTTQKQGGQGYILDQINDNAVTDSTGNSQPMDITNPFLAAMWIIKV